MLKTIQQEPSSSGYEISDHEKYTIEANHQYTREAIYRFSLKPENLVSLGDRVCKAKSVWNKSTISSRQQILTRIYDSLAKNLTTLAQLESNRTGKSATDSCSELRTCLAHWKYAQNILGNYTASREYNGCKVQYVPYGCVLLIVPYNFPSIVLSERLPYVLASGNTAVIKPSELTVGAIPEMLKIINQASGLEDLTILVEGNAKLSARLVTSQYVDYVSFTGSTNVGRYVGSLCGNSLKPYSLELGGTNPIIVSDSSDLELASELVLRGITYHRGQCCISTEKCHVHSSIYQDFVSLLREKSSNISTRLSSSTLFQPYTVYKKQLDFIKTTGYSSWMQETFQKELIIYTNTAAFASDQETFGMFLGLSRYNDYSSLLRSSHFTKAGLAAVLVSNDLNEQSTFVRETRYGRLWINDVLVSDVRLPLGGFGDSGHGREAGITAMDTYTTTKSLMLR